MSHSCRCGARWRSLRAAHCAVCHRTFGAVSGFDAHRRGGTCHDPAARGLVERDGVWRQQGVNHIDRLITRKASAL